MEPIMEIIINGKAYPVEVPGDTPLLWFIREEVGLFGTRFGCGQALCGACTIHVGGVPRRACVLPVRDVLGQEVTTIEGLSGQNGELHPVQQAWIEQNVPQCGYCQSGQIMSAVALLKAQPNPTDDQIDAAMSGNLCRCGTYPRIRKAIKLAAQNAQPPKPKAAEPAATKEEAKP